MGSREGRGFPVNGGNSFKTELKKELEFDAEAVEAIAAIAVLALVGWGIRKLLRCWETQSRKKIRICKDEFEDDPASWSLIIARETKIFLYLRMNLCFSIMCFGFYFAYTKLLFPS